MPIFDAAERYKAEGVPVIVVGGKEYGTGSSRDWAAKGPKLLGVRAVIAESFERIHRFQSGRHGRSPAGLRSRQDAQGLRADGQEIIDIPGLSGTLIAAH